MKLPTPIALGVGLIAAGFASAQTAPSFVADFSATTAPVLSDALQVAGSAEQVPALSSAIGDGGAGAAGTRSVTHTLSGEFLVQNGLGYPRNPMWEYFFEPGSRFKKIILDFDVYIGQFGGSVNGEDFWRAYQYILFWVQKDGFQRWDQLLGYGYLWDPGIYFEVQSNAGSPSTLKLSTGCGLQTNTWYHVQWIYDTQYGGVGLQWAEFLKDGRWVCSAETAVGLDSIDMSYAFIGFGTWDSPEGPEGVTSNWRWANLRLQFVGDQPAGPRPRRR